MPMKHDDSETPRLPLTRAMKQYAHLKGALLTCRRYDAIIQTYEQLAEMVLNTMRLEIRCRVMCNLGSLMQKVCFWQGAVLTTRETFDRKVRRWNPTRILLTSQRYCWRAKRSRREPLWQRIASECLALVPCCLLNSSAFCSEG